MDARALLDRVADALQRVTHETGDDQSSRSQHKVKASFLAPDHYRHETRGSHVRISVVNGLEYASYDARMNHFCKGTLKDREHATGVFRPEYPAAASYLFTTIGERVQQADWLRDEPGHHVVSVAYEPASNFPLSCSPVEFWIDSSTDLVSRYQLEMTTRRPGQDATQHQKYFIETIRVAVNEPIDSQVFELEQPPDAMDMSQHPGGVGVGHGGGGSGVHFNHRGVQGSSSRDWSGETFVERSKLRLHGVDLEFEHRLTPSQDKHQLEIEVSFTSPSGDKKQWSQSVKLLADE